MIERLAVALCTAVFAGLTLLAYSFIAVALLGTRRDDFGVMKFVSENVFSETGIAIVAGAALLGFAIGGDRMAALFSVLWGTHPAWSRFHARLQPKIEAMGEGPEVSPWIVAGVIIVIGGLWLWLAP